MINERVIERLLDILDESVSKFRTRITPDQQWLSEVNWLVHDLRRDLDLQRFEFEGMAPYSELKELKDRIDELEEDNDRLEDELDEAPSQDDLDELRDEVKDLEEQLSERDKLIDRLTNEPKRYEELMSQPSKKKEGDNDVHV